MANKTVTLTKTNIGGSTGNYNIYHTAVSAPNLILTGVTQAALEASVEFVVDEALDTFYVVSDTPDCTNQTIVIIDEEAPSVPSSFYYEQYSETSFTLYWAASTDNIAVTGYKIYKNGGFYVDTFSTSTSERILGETIYDYNNWSVSAYDGNGNESAQTSVISARVTDGVFLIDRYQPNGVNSWDFSFVRAGWTGAPYYYWVDNEQRIIYNGEIYVSWSTIASTSFPFWDYLSFGSWASSIKSLDIDGTGYKMYAWTNVPTNRMLIFTLGLQWDVGTAQYPPQILTNFTPSTNYQGFTWAGNGLSWYTMDTSTRQFLQVYLSQAWDLTTSVANNTISYGPFTSGLNITGGGINEAESLLYFADATGNTIKTMVVNTPGNFANGSGATGSISQTKVSEASSVWSSSASANIHLFSKVDNEINMI